MIESNIHFQPWVQVQLSIISARELHHVLLLWKSLKSFVTLIFILTTEKKNKVFYSFCDAWYTVFVKLKKFLRQGHLQNVYQFKNALKWTNYLLVLLEKLFDIQVEVLMVIPWSLRRLSTCFIPVYSMRSSKEIFPVCATVSNICVKQLGLMSNTVYFDSHNTLRLEGGGGVC